MKNEEKVNHTNTSIEKIFDFLNIISGLKKARRYGKYNIDADSSADHSWRLCLMGFVIADELKINIDVLRAMKIALIHDLPEAITGDIPYADVYNGHILKENKHKDEIQAMNKIVRTLPDKIGNDIFELWEEYENAETREALFIKALDKLETTTHVSESVRGYTDLDMIAMYPDKHVNKFPELKPILIEIKKRLKIEFRKRGLEWKKEYDEY